MGGRCRYLAVEIPDHRHRYLLRARHPRPRGHAAKQRDEVAPSHNQPSLPGQPTTTSRGGVVHHSTNRSSTSARGQTERCSRGAIQVRFGPVSCRAGRAASTARKSQERTHAVQQTTAYSITSLGPDTLREAHRRGRRENQAIPKNASITSSSSPNERSSSA